MNNQDNEEGGGNDGPKNLARDDGRHVKSTGVDNPPDSGRHVSSTSADNQPEPEISARLAAKAIQELDKQLEATKCVVIGDGASKDVPDYPTRQKAIELVLAYRLGRPIERQVKLTGGFQSHNDKVAALCATPEGLRMAIAVGLVQEDTRTPGRPTLKSEKKPKDLKVSELRNLNKPENDQKPVSQDCDKSKLF